MTLNELLHEIVESLEEKDIHYMISGSLAMSAYSMPRMTRDIDIIIELGEDNLEKFLSMFGSDFYLHKPSIEVELRRRGMFNVIDQRSGYKIDFVIRKNSPFRRTEFNRKVRSNVLGVEAWLVSIEDLILSKLIWIQEIQSRQQMEDIKNLLENRTIDADYISDWIKELNLNTFDLLTR